MSKLLPFTLFAYDTTIYCSGNSMEQLLNTMEIQIKLFKNGATKINYH